MAISCYMVVSPDPRATVSATYYVKFGDGPSEAAYHRCNPDHWYVQNDLAPAQTLNVVTYDRSAIARQPGKWLEWIHLKIAGGVPIYERTEWHKLQVKPGQDPNELRNRLVAMLGLFGNWNRWEEDFDGVPDSPTLQFENLVDSTWRWGALDVVATFVN